MNGGFGRWLRFNAVGLIGVVVQLMVLATLVRTGTGLMVATFVAVEAAVVHNFIWHQRWTWRDRRAGHSVFGRFLRFNLANGLVSIAGNLAITWLLGVQLGVHYLIANVIAIVVCSLINFLTSDRLVFTTGEHASPR